MAPARHALPARDGRTLVARDYGPEVGLPVVFHHGTPSCGVVADNVLDVAARLGLRLIAYDRAGYGGSCPKPGRRVADAAADTRDVADALGLDRFAVWGVSGGGPHALACAALLRERVSAAAIVCGLAPCDAPGFDFWTGMGAVTRREWGIARDERDRLERFVRESAAAVAASPERMIEEWGSLLWEGDRALLRGRYGRDLMKTLDLAVSGGIAGWVDDDVAFVEPWGFDLGLIAVPVAVFHGERDAMIPHSHGAYLARSVPHARFFSYPADGHLTLDAAPDDALEWLARDHRSS